MSKPTRNNVLVRQPIGMATRPTETAALPSVALLRRGESASHQQWSLRAQWWLTACSPLLLFFCWEVAASAGVMDRRFFPPPTEIAVSAATMFEQGVLLTSMAVSLRRLAIGFGFGALAGVAVGLWLGLSAWSRALIEPWIQVTYPIPKLALYPLLVLIVGIGEAPILLLLGIAVFYIVCINTIASVLSIRPVYLDVGRDCRANFRQFFATIALPASLPHICTSLELAIGVAYIVLIAAEFVGTRTGLGAIIWSSWQLFDVAQMYVAIVVVGLLGYAAVVLMRLAAGILMPWHTTIK
jgi:ABC-type nitrate/sulfonate/bicarbonate transport system permease component